MDRPTKKWHTREDSGIRLDRELRWWHDDEPVEHPHIVEAFNRGLKPTDDGRFRLEFGNDWCFVTVEDAAYEVRSVEVGEGAVSAELSDRTRELLDLSTLSLDERGALVCRVKSGRAKARFSREAQFQLGSHVEQTPQGLALRAGTKLLSLPLPSLG